MWLLLGGCWENEEQLRLRRIREMQDHEADSMAARDALARGDPAAARAAGARLAEPDVLPALPDGTLPFLVAVRDGGHALTLEADLPSAAATLVGVTADCAGCHRALAIAAPQPFDRNGLDLAWIGLVFESEERWDAGVAALGADSRDLAAARSWPDRRDAFARRLGGVPSRTSARAGSHTP